MRTTELFTYVIVYTDSEVSSDSAKLPFTSSQDESSCRNNCQHFPPGVLYLASGKTKYAFFFFFYCLHLLLLRTIIYILHRSHRRETRRIRSGEKTRIFFFFLCKFPKFYYAPVNALVWFIFSLFKIMLSVNRLPTFQTTRLLKHARVNNIHRRVFTAATTGSIVLDFYFFFSFRSTLLRAND